MKILRTLQKIILTVIFACFLSIVGFSQNSVGINTTTPNANAALDIVSTNHNQGLKIPSLTTAQRTDPAFTGILTTAEKGLLVFDSVATSFYFWDGAAWSKVSKGEIPTLDEVLGVSNSAASKKIIDLANPSDPQDAATKKYIDDSLTVVNSKITNLFDSVTFITTSIGNINNSITNINKNITDLFDSVTFINTDLLNLDNRLTTTENNVTNLFDSVTNINNDITSLYDSVTNINNNLTLIDGRLTTVEGDIVTIKNDVTNLYDSVTTINNDITSLYDSVTNINNNMTLIDGRLTTVEGDIVTIKNDVTNLYDSVTNINVNIGNLYDSVTNINNDITSLYDSVTNINNNIAIIDGRLTTVEGDIVTIKNDVTNLYDSVTNINVNIGNLYDSVTTINTNISSLFDSVTNINNNITSLYDSVSTINSNVSNLYDSVSNITNQVNNLISNPSFKLPQGQFFVGDVNDTARATAKNTIPISGFGNATTDVSIGNGVTNYRITNVLDPVNPQDVATKKYVTDAMAGAGLGDMLKSTYDTGNNGIVDNAEKVNGLTVQTAVPAGAIFTDAQTLGLAANTLSISGGNNVSLAPYLDNTDAQTLGLAANTLSISGGNNVSLAPYLDNTDAQDLTLAANTLSLTGDATPVSLAPYLDNTDAQTLSIAANNLTITGGNSVSLAPYLDNTDAQDLTLVGNTLSLTGDATTINLAPYLDNTDNQTLANVLAQGNSAGGVTITNLLDPVNPQDAATKKYVTDALTAGGLGDMLKATYDTGNNGVVDNAEKVNGLTVQTAVPAGAVFTDAQTLSLAANTLSISGGNNVSLAPYLDNTDAQNISIAGNAVSISGGTGFNLSNSAPGANEVLTWDGTKWDALAGGTVSTASVVSANGFAGTVASATTTPAITLTTTVNGLVKGNGTALSAAVAGTDYLVPNGAIVAGTNTKITYDTKGFVTAGAPALLASADYANQGTVTGLLHGNAAGNPAWGQIVNADITNATINLTTKVTGVLPIANGGTNNGALAVTNGGVVYADGAKLMNSGVGIAGQVLSSNGAAAPTWINAATGTVTTASVVSANGFAGTVATPGSTPAITLTTSVNGMVKGNGTALSAAVAGTDYLVPNGAIVAGTNTKITYDTKGFVTAGAPATLASADFANQGSVTGLLHGNAAGNPAWGQIVNADITNSTIDLTTKVTGALPIANGGTNNAALAVTNGGVVYSDGTKLMNSGVGIAGQILKSNGAGAPTWINDATGTVTTASVVSANGFAGTVANPGTTPAITLTTSVNGMVKGNGTALSAAVGGTDYVIPNAAIGASTNTKITYDAKGLVTGSAAATLASADFANQGSVTGLLHGNAAGNPAWGQIVNADITNSTIDLTTKVTGALPIANGGTNNAALAVTNGGVVYSDGTKLMNSGVGVAGQILKSNGAGAPTWVADANTTYTAGEGMDLTGTTFSIKNISSLTDNSVPRWEESTNEFTTGSIWDDGTHVRIGNSAISSSYTLQVSGAFKTDNIYHSSDVRWKKNILPIDNALAKVEKLQGVTYDWRTDEFPERNFSKDKQIGLIAQDVEKVLPELVMTDDSGYKSVEYANIVAVLIEAIKEQQKIIESQKLEIDNLKVSNTAMQQQVDKLQVMQTNIDNLEKQMSSMQALLLLIQPSAVNNSK